MIVVMMLPMPREETILLAGTLPQEERVLLAEPLWLPMVPLPLLAGPLPREESILLAEPLWLPMVPSPLMQLEGLSQFKDSREASGRRGGHVLGDVEAM